MPASSPLFFFRLLLQPALICAVLGLTSLTAIPRAAAQAFEGRHVKSEVLGKKVPFSIYLPPGWNQSQRRYPVVYLLHGIDGSESDWIQYGYAAEELDCAISEDILPPMIVVMPAAWNTYYINDHTGKQRYEDFFLTELIPWIDTNYPTRNTREFRAVAGLSMGGYGSLHLALRNPQLFSACAGLSAAVRSEATYANLQDERYQRFAPLFGQYPKGPQRITPHWRTYDPVSIVNSSPADRFKGLRIWLDCGDDDYLSEGNALLHVAMLQRGVAHEYRVRDGGHNWNYWRSGLIPALQYIARSFTR